MKEKADEIVFEEKLHITETEEIIEAEIPLTVQELTKVDGNFLPQRMLKIFKFKIHLEWK